MSIPRLRLGWRVEGTSLVLDSSASQYLKLASPTLTNQSSSKV